jgi:nascent polypeptide-associated complex subunit alpha
MFNMEGKQMEKMMKQLGIKSESIEAEEVTIRTSSKDIVIRNPQVTKIKMGGQETFQIIGEASEKSREGFSDDDVSLVAKQTGRSEEEARSALEEEGDMAAAIMKLKK